MADIFNVQNSVGGQATSTASSAAAVPAINSLASAQNGRIFLVTVDSYCRIAFGGSTVTATAASQLFAPGSVEVSVPVASNYYSVLTPSGTANYSISSGNVINVSPQGF